MTEHRNRWSEYQLLLVSNSRLARQGNLNFFSRGPMGNPWTAAAARRSPRGRRAPPNYETIKLKFDARLRSSADGYKLLIGIQRSIACVCG